MVASSLTLDNFFRLSPATRRLVEREMTRDPEAPVTITEAAILCGCSVDTLKRLEKEGKIGKIRRNKRGYRMYTNDDLFRIMNLPTNAA